MFKLAKITKVMETTRSGWKPIYSYKTIISFIYVLPQKHFLLLGLVISQYSLREYLVLWENRLVCYWFGERDLVKNTEDWDLEVVDIVIDFGNTWLTTQTRFSLALASSDLNIDGHTLVWYHCVQQLGVGCVCKAERVGALFLKFFPYSFSRLGPVEVLSSACLDSNVFFIS